MNKHVLIAGASRGLGYFLAGRYLEIGDIVYAGVRDTNSALIRALKEQYGEQLIVVEMDVSSSASVQKSFDVVRQYTDKIDIIINNAGIHSETSFEELDSTNLDECLEVYNVNAIGPLRVVQAFLSMLKGLERSMIVNISSESGKIQECRRKKEFDYCMSKAALNMATKILDNALKEKNIKLLALHPGWMRTDMGGQNASLDPYKTAVKLSDLLAREMQSSQEKIFIDNEGNRIDW